MASVVSSSSIYWAYRLDYASTAVNDGAIDLSEYYTVDMIDVMPGLSRLIGFGACYDVNGNPKQGCTSFLIFQIYHQGTTSPAGCSQRIVVSKHSIVYNANAFRKYYMATYYSTGTLLYLSFTDSDTLGNIDKIGGAGKNKGLFI